MMRTPSCKEVGGPKGTYLAVRPSGPLLAPELFTVCGPGWKTVNPRESRAVSRYQISRRIKGFPAFFPFRELAVIDPT